jgi:hypothetical protein
MASDAETSANEPTPKPEEEIESGRWAACHICKPDH